MNENETKYICEKIYWEFDLTMSEEEIYSLVNRIISNGFGDWGIISQVAPIDNKMQTFTKNYRYTLPIEVTCIEINQSAVITKEVLLRAIRKTLIDFPYALNTNAGYNLDVDKLTDEDIDEIIQVAVFGCMRHGYTWAK